MQVALGDDVMREIAGDEAGATPRTAQASLF
jgi:hypothetical protein